MEHTLPAKVGIQLKKNTVPSGKPKIYFNMQACLMLGCGIIL